ncbi:hypothetical protein VFPPC_18373 [Pochonia chlamydosporia 170]|uniref:Uncharacterized protein n=1 Tax=Pochonia chlamydosporia 170 TaxID=1380566 RepID=A0A219ANU5_METCM|nr:hypothetical protein VFPPC_18373 [Pochonia chlamydosporia 170]OWT42423.1 hypothetical protein VFPPC_18373 [Pochonia chlamydosporia 170]
MLWQVNPFTSIPLSLCRWYLQSLTQHNPSLQVHLDNITETLHELENANGLCSHVNRPTRQNPQTEEFCFLGTR